MTLSPGKDHLEVPRGPLDNLQYRVWLNDECERDPEFREGVRDVCRNDLIYYTNAFVWQKNPRKKGVEVAPFVNWDYQDDLDYKILDFIERDEDVLIEKSRETGLSWKVLIIFDWLCRFHRDKNFLCISHTEDAVDRPDDPNSLFWKLSFLHNHLPDWLRGGTRKKKLGFAYPETESFITGAATTERAGVGGRVTAVLLDEFAKQKDAGKIWQDTADTGCRIVVSTHYGVGTKFYDLSLGPRPKKLVVHWSQHPEKSKGLYRSGVKPKGYEVLDKTFDFGPDFEFDKSGLPAGGPRPGLRSPWYDEEVLRRQSLIAVAMHLDIDPPGSASQFFDAKRISELKAECEPAWWRGDVNYDKDTGEPLGLVRTEGGPLKLWCFTDAAGRPRRDQYFAGADVGVGQGSTPSCLSVMGRDSKKVVEYANAHIDPDDFATLAVALCKWFADVDDTGAFLAWELNGHGSKFGNRVVEIGYRNVFFRTDFESISKKANYDRPGWNNTPRNALLVFSDYRKALQGGELFNPSVEALDECLAYNYVANTVKHGKASSTDDPTAARENHGDRATADALMWMAGKDHVERPGKPAEPAVLDTNSLAGRRKLAEDRRREREEA